MANTAPSDFTVTPASARAGETLTFRWKAGAGDFVQYRVYGTKSTGSFTASVYVDKSKLTATGTFPNDIPDGGYVNYRVSLAAADGSGGEDSSDNFTVRKAADVTAPTNFTVSPSSAKSGDALTFRWNAASGDFTQYRIYGTKSTGSFTPSIYADKSKLTAAGTFPNDIPDGGYVQYRIVPCDSSGAGLGPESSNYTVHKITETVETPSAPSSITVGNTVRGKPVSVSWTAVSGASSYTLQRSVSGGTFTAVYTGPALSYTDIADNQSWSSVQYRVKAVVDGNSSDWKVSAAKTMQNPPDSGISLPSGGRLVQLENNKGQPVFPITVTEGIFRQSSGKSLESILDTIEKTPGPAGPPGADGKNGKDGQDGKDGKDGADGAPGNLMYAVFSLDPKTGELCMIADQAYAGPSFRLNNGNLEVVLNYGS